MDCPYPGLRPFTRDEAYIFFGREAQTDELLKRLNERRFLAVVGPSGCGKSSLVRAGMIPALETGFMLPAGPRWAFAQMRPGSRPIRRLAEALVKEAGFSPSGLNQAEAFGFLHALLLRGPLGLLEALRETPLPDDTNLLILVDQFEEIFRFRREGNADEADAFISLLLRCTEQRELPIYVVITMRSDFFGDCALLTGLPEAINRSQYLTPRLTRDQRQAAIEGPARVFGGDVEPELVNHLLNEMSNDPDQLPLLQHLLMRMWTWRSDATMSCTDLLTPVGDTGIADAVEGAHTLTMEDYTSIGGLANALSNHAEEAFATLSEAQQNFAQIMFRRLSERGRDNRDVRRPSAAGEIATLAGLSVDEIVKVVDVFRAPGCSFVVPACPEPIYGATVLDITHESFLRQWKRLKGWIDDETQSVETFRFLEQSARHWQEGRAALWGSPNLDVALDWRKKERPTAEWGKRYGGNFKAAIAFLDASELARQAELARKEAVRKAGVRRLRRVAAGFAALSALMAASILYTWDMYYREHTAYYNTFVKMWGIAEGYGELTDKQRQARLISLKVLREGRSGPVRSMEAVNGAGRCDPRHTIGTVLEFNESDSPSHRECRWEFVRDARGDVAYELAFNQFDTFVWGLAYTPKTPVLGEQRRAYFLDARGQIASLKNSRAEMVEFTYSPEGYEIRHSYFDRDGLPQPGRDLAYSQKRSFTPDGLELELVSLDKDGRPMNDNVGNASWREEHDALGNIVRGEVFDKDGNKVTTTQGWQRFEADYDDAGNRREERYFNALGGPALCKPCSAHKIVSEYTDSGFLKSQALYGTSNQPIEHGDLKYHKASNKNFDEQGNVTGQRYYGIDGEGTKDSLGCHAKVMKYNQFGQITETQCYGLDFAAIDNTEEYHSEKIDYDLNGNVIAFSNFDKDGSKTVTKEGYHRLALHRDRRGNDDEKAYFDDFGRPVNVISEGFHRLIKTYNPLGQPVEWRFYGADGRPIATQNGYHREVAAYNQRGHQTEVGFFAVDGQPVKHKNGYHRQIIENDEQGNARERAYYDEAGHLIALPDGYAVIRQDYDIRGNVTEGRTFGPQRQPIPHKSGCTIWRAQYDDQSRRIKSECYDGNEKPVRNKDGYARWTEKYDANGNMIEEARYDENGLLIAPPESYARLVQAFDGRNNKIEEAYYDADGGLLMQAKGYAKFVSKYDARNNLTEMAFFDAQDHLKRQNLGAARITAKYDDRGNKTEVAFYGEDNRLILYEGRFARRTSQFDEHDNQTAEAFYDVDSKLRSQRDGYARWTKTFDDRANQIEEAYYDADNRLTLRPEGYARWTKKFDRNNRQIEISYFGIDGRPTRHRDGYARLTTKHDERGNPIEEAYYDEDGRLLMQSSGYAVLRGEYDDKNRLTMLAFYDDQDRLTLDEGQGFAIKRWVFADAGGPLVETLFDANKQVILRAEIRRDADGNEIDRHMIGPSGEALIEAVFVSRVLPDTTAASLELQPRDRLISYDGNDVRSVEGMREMVDARGAAVRTLVIDRNGQRLSFQVPRGKLGIEMSRRFILADLTRASPQESRRQTGP